MRADGDLAPLRSGVIVNALLLSQQKCIDEAALACQIVVALRIYKNLEENQCIKNNEVS